MIPDNLNNEFEKIISRECFSKKIHPVREKAYRDLNEQGLPNKKWEDWRHTDLSIINYDKFRISEAQDAPPPKIDIAEYGLKSFHTIVFYNGHFQKDLSSIPNGIKLLSNLEYMEFKNWKVNQPKMSSFDLLNTAFMDSGMCLIIKKETNVKIPLRILFICSGNEEIMVSPRIHIDLEKSSSLNLVEQHVGKCNKYLYNGSIIINIEEKAKLEHIRIQNNSKSTINMGNLHIEQRTKSNYFFVQYAVGSQLGRINLFANLIEKGANCSLNGLSLSDNKQHLDAHVITNHKASHCESSQNFKFILKDRSTGVFNGRSIVQHGAVKTDSSQSNKNLLLSDNALMNSNPQLEIYTDDVKCSHGSSTGALESDALFYIRSRGLDQKAATSLLVLGFASKIIEIIKNNEIKNYVTCHFDQWINQNN